MKIDCQGLVARLTQDTIILTSAVKLGKNWRELAEKLARLTKQQIEAYEGPHQGKNGAVALEVRVWCNRAHRFPPLHKHSQGPSFFLVFQASFLLNFPVEVSVAVLSFRARFNPFLLSCPLVNLIDTSALISDMVRRISWSLQEPPLITLCTTFRISTKRKLTSIINTFLCQCNSCYHLA